MVRREMTTEANGLAGGRGPARVHHVLSKDELMGHGRVYARIVLPPKSSIGWHQHVGETEPYYILKGEGDFIDDDRSVTRVRAGNVCLIQVGHWHSIENNSDSDLEFMALIIYNEAGRNAP